jgi:very-short-patch-repair endonuclease
VVCSTPKPSWRSVLELAARQHGAVAFRQLTAMGMSRTAIAHRRRRGRLHPVFREVYALGRPELSQHGWWMAAVLACGDQAALSHSSAAALAGFGAQAGSIEVSVPRDVRRRGIRVHFRTGLTDLQIVERDGIPVTAPAQTMADLAVRATSDELERMVNAADKLDVLHWDALPAALASLPPTPGVAKFRDWYARHNLVVTDSELERMMIPIVRRAGLPQPLTQVWLDGFRVDFYWPDLGLVVETDGLRYHRTPSTQARDARRDQIHAAAGRTPLRFSHAQVAYERREVEQTLRDVASRLRARQRSLGT